MIAIGIDPGQTGAIALVIDGVVTELHDMPTMARVHGKGIMVNATELFSILLEMVSCRSSPPAVKLEAVHAMPGQGVSSMFKFGESYGIVQGVVASLSLPLTMVTPQLWKKQCGLIGKGKDASRTLVIQQHPEIADMLTRKKDNGRSDAICIAKAV